MSGGRNRSPVNGSGTGTVQTGTDNRSQVTVPAAVQITPLALKSATTMPISDSPAIKPDAIGMT